MRIPHEFDLGGIYLPPIMIAFIFGVILALIAASIMNKYRLARYIVNTPLVFIAMIIIFTVLLGLTIIPF